VRKFGRAQAPASEPMAVSSEAELFGGAADNIDAETMNDSDEM
jgi:hypothetical protein